MTTWWDKASTAERLAQIDGGIECGLTMAEVAIASGTSFGAIAGFCNRQGLKFGTRSTHTAGQRRTGKIRSDRSAYIRGDHIDLWGNADHRDEFALDEREGA